MRQLINFSDSTFQAKRRWNSKSAKLIAGFDEVREFTPQDIDYSKTRDNPDYSKEKGIGFYFWKPQLVKKALADLKHGDYLAYADSGSYFIKSTDPLFKYMEENDNPFLFYKLPLYEKQWTKRDAFILMDCDKPEYADTPQISASFFILKKNDQTVAFVDEWLSFCEDVRIIGNHPNVLGKPNYPEFIDHRCDQSVLSLLIKKWEIARVPDITDYGAFPRMYYHKKAYLFDKSVLNAPNKFAGIILHNRKKSPLGYGIRYYLRRLMLNFGIRMGHDKFVHNNYD